MPRIRVAKGRLARRRGIFVCCRIRTLDEASGVRRGDGGREVAQEDEAARALILRLRRRHGRLTKVADDLLLHGGAELEEGPAKRG